jgi:hypothetical protein
VFSLGILLGASLDVVGVLSDLSMDLLVELFNGLGSALGEGLEPSLELDILFLSSLKGLQVLVNVNSQNSFSELDVVSFGLAGIIAREAGSGVRNVHTSISNTLKGSEDLRAGSGGLKTDIENDFEGSSVLLILRGIVVLLDGGVSSIGSVKSDLFEESSGNEETSGIGGSIVVETSGNSESSEFVGVSLGEDLITLDGGVDDLSDDSGGGDSHDESVLGGVVFVLILLNQSLSGEVVSLSLTSSEEFGLVSHEVSFVLDELDEGHLW